MRISAVTVTVRLEARWTWDAECASVNTTSAPMLLRGVLSRLSEGLRRLRVVLGGVAVNTCLLRTWVKLC